jgi:cytosine/adenosine deaminase-related metal-dependent hydrolase
MGWTKPVSFVNARVFTQNGVARSIRFASRVLALDEAPHRGDAVLDLDGAVVLPGLINAHDHLELNHYGALKRRDVYANATEWIDDLRPALSADDQIRTRRAQPLADRLFIGGLKNLLAGVTTVAHHNPLYDEIAWHVPLRVVRRFGWAHSFALEGQPVGAHGERGHDVRRSCLATAANRPFLVHAGEGVDEPATRELVRLGELGCLRDNTVIVHGVAMTSSIWRKYLDHHSSVIWCPASNQFLFNRTLPVREMLDSHPDGRRHVCLGTDSRLTGSRDLLDELQLARHVAPLTASELMAMVTDVPASVLKLSGAGTLDINVPSDLLVVPASDKAKTGSREGLADSLLATRRDAVQLVVIGGRPLVGAQRMSKVFAARRVRTRCALVDGVPRLVAARLVRRIERSAIAEPGIVIH